MEPETPALIAPLRRQTLLASELVRAELRRAVARMVPELLPAADALVTRLRLVRLDAELLDAIHLQSALLLADNLDAFVTYDLRQADAARDVGLVVRAPACSTPAQ